MKRIIILCDGTGQSASRGKYSVSTNVNRFSHALSNDGPIQQLIFYQSGIGTQDLSSWTKNVTSALGYGLEDNVLDAYMFLMNNYSPGDEIFVFGFSRGAFTARVLANFIARVGVFRKPQYTWELKRAWKAYREGAKGFQSYMKDLQERIDKWDKTDPAGPRARKVKVKVVGCWDTVASIGVPDYTSWLKWSETYDYLDGSLVGGIEHAFHALALDECRYPFSPTLWFLPEDKSVAATIDLKQTWFPGVHTNIGGGYADHALADLTLAWMVDLCRPYLDFSESYIDLCVKLNHVPAEINSKDRREVTEGKTKGYDETYQGWGRGHLYDSYGGGDTWTWKYRSPGEYGSSGKGPTNEKIHASVRERWETMSEWRPNSLDKFKPEQRGDKHVWVKKGLLGKEVVIEEEAFTSPKGYFEWKLRYEPIPPAAVKEHK